MSSYCLADFPDVPGVIKRGVEPSNCMILQLHQIRVPGIIMYNCTPVPSIFQVMILVLVYMAGGTRYSEYKYCRTFSDAGKGSVKMICISTTEELTMMQVKDWSRFIGVSAEDHTLYMIHQENYDTSNTYQ